MCVVDSGSFDVKIFDVELGTAVTAGSED